jgi:hypothetical protein
MIVERRFPAVGMVLAVIGLLLALVLFRGRVWFQSLSDLAIGLYAYGGQAWLEGHLPYTLVWDYRPPGLFALYAMAIKLFGVGLAPNVLTTAALAATTIAVGFLGVRFDPQRRASTGWWAAAFFVMLSPVNEGIWGAAEVEVSAFVAWCVWFSTKDETSTTDAAIAGLLAACALLCKLSAAFLIVTPFIVLLARRTPAASALQRAIAFAGGWIVPIGVVVALYARAREVAALIDANVWASLRRTHTLNGFYAGDAAHIIPWQLYFLGPQLQLALFAMSKRCNAERVATWGWFAGGVAAVVVPAEFFPRQFVMLTAPTALLGALGFAAIVRWLRQPRLGAIFAAVVVGATFFLHDYFETTQTLRYVAHRFILRESHWHEDELAVVTGAVRRIAPQHRSIFVIEESPYIYDALDIPAPTRYALTELLLDPRLSRTGGIDGMAELRRIFATQPEIVVVSDLSNRRWDPARVQFIRSVLVENYAEVFRAATVRVYRKR